ncbi:MAG: hypothetical protein SGI86_02630 [Deltaproteobacteria bacterium]|nr:hypothetical protein [Deltaproteobacteria bacterium]
MREILDWLGVKLKAMSKRHLISLLTLFAGCSKTTPVKPHEATATPVSSTATQTDAEAALEEEAEVEVPEKFTAMGAWIVGETLSMRIAQATLVPQLEAGQSVATPPAEHRFVRVQIEIENRGVTPQRVRAKRFTLRDRDGRDNPISAAHQTRFAQGSDELLLVPGMREPFELIFTLHNRTEAGWITFEDAMTRLVGEVKAVEQPLPGMKRAARGKAKSAPSVPML